MAAAFECGLQPQLENVVGEPECDDPASHREDVRVVVLAGEPCGVEIVAEGGSGARHLVRGHLLALSAPAEDDAPVGLAGDDRSGHAHADGRIVGRCRAVGPVVVHDMAQSLQRPFEVLFEEKAGVIGSDGDAHGVRLYYGCHVTPSVSLSARGERRLHTGHPWIYRSDVDVVRAAPGDRVQVRGPNGRVLAWALFSDRSQIALRLLAVGEEEPTDAVIRDRIAAAIAFRTSLGIDATAYRLVHGEADRLPSLVVDRYGEHVVLQTLSQGMDRLRPLVVQVIGDLLAPKGILARNDPRTRLLEGLDRQVDVLVGEIPDVVQVRELAVAYDVDLRRGQKTGLFLDQRENRAAAARYARGRLLDCFSYNGGFALSLAGSCDGVTALDVSADAVERIQHNARLNGITLEARVVNVFDELRGLERAGERFDTIVLDPPAFAKSKSAVAGAVAGYKEINLRAMKLLQPGGTLVTCSCSYNVGEELFAEVLRHAAIDAGTLMTVLDKRSQGRDHPILLGVPETHYLKCFILRKLA